jgi:hypothetical protein
MAKSVGTTPTGSTARPVTELAAEPVVESAGTGPDVHAERPHAHSAQRALRR